MYVFTQYTNGTVLLKSKARISASLNYDAANRVMMYIENKNEMILDASQGIDTIYIAKRKFIPHPSKGFLEMVSLKNGTIFINWSLRQLLRGKKGAYGQVIQGSVAALDVNAIKEQSGSINRESVDVYTQLNENEYWLLNMGKFVKCNNEKSLLKLFPGKEEQIKEFIREKKMSFKNTLQAIDIINFSLGIAEKSDR